MQNTTTVLVIVLVVVLVLFLFGGIGMMGFGMMGGGMMNRMMGGYGGYGYGFNPLGAIISLVSWLLVIGGVVLLVVWLVRNAGKTTGVAGATALEILKSRYAKGEITKEQYDAIKRDLES